MMPTKTTRGWLLLVLDLLWSCLIISPLVVAFWRGCWNLHDWYDPQVSPPAAPWMEVAKRAAFCGILATLELSKFYLGEWLMKRHAAVQCLGGRLFIAMKGMVMVAYLRNIWITWRHFEANTDIFLVILLTVILSRMSKNLIYSPLSICLDSHEATFKDTTILRIPRFGPPTTFPLGAAGMYLVDIFLSNFGMRQIFAMSWVAGFSVVDTYLPSTTSLLLGYTLALLTLLLDQLLQKLRSCTTIAPLLWTADLTVTLVALSSSLLVFRGLWNLQDGLLGDLVSVLLSLTILSLLGVSNCLATDRMSWEWFQPVEGIVNIDYWGQEQGEGKEDGGEYQLIAGEP